MKLTFASAHGFDLATLKARAEARLDHYAARHPQLALREHFRWTSERSATGAYRGGVGTLTLGEREVTLELDLPFFARAFRGRVEAFVRAELATALAVARDAP